LHNPTTLSSSDETSETGHFSWKENRNQHRSGIWELTPTCRIPESPHYHSDMSPEYLEMTYNDFANPDGTVLILHATSGAGEVSEKKLCTD
jgi:hypothetical protein